MTLLENLRYRLAAVNDDFYEDKELMDYLNKSKTSVFSMLVRYEKQQAPFGSVRGLDLLRKEHSITPSSYSLIDDRYYKSTATIDRSDIDTILYAERQSEFSKVPVRELHSGSLFLLERGNVIPSLYENYYTHINNSTDSQKATGKIQFVDDGANFETTPKITITITVLGQITTIDYFPTAETLDTPTIVTSFVTLINSRNVPFTASVDQSDLTGSTLLIKADNDGVIYNGVLGCSITNIFDLTFVITNTIGGTNIGDEAKLLRLYTDEDSGNITLYYIKTPVVLTEESTTLIDLPNRLESAILMGATLEALRKNPNDTQQKMDIFMQQQQQELQNNLY